MSVILEMKLVEKRNGSSVENWRRGMDANSYKGYCSRQVVSLCDEVEKRDNLKPTNLTITGTATPNTQHTMHVHRTETNFFCKKGNNVST